ncbi:hypothetical protein JCM10213v2_001048 [Rhodosporidiobolus nylandii]
MARPREDLKAFFDKAKSPYPVTPDLSTASWAKGAATADDFYNEANAIRPGDVRVASVLSGSSLWSQLHCRETFCTVQRCLAKELLSQDACVDLPQYWTQLPAKTRREVGLTALYLVVNEAAFGDAREHAPDLTLASICDPVTFLSLLTTVFSDGLQYKEKDEYTEMASPLTDALWEIEREESLRQRSSRAEVFSAWDKTLKRQLYLVLFTRTLAQLVIDQAQISLKVSVNPSNYRVSKPAYNNLSFRGNEACANPHIGVENWQTEESQEQLLGEGRFRMQAGTAYAKSAHVNPTGKKLDRPERCMACGRKKEEVEELVKTDKSLSHCAKCIPVQRRYPYCSRDCQVRDYKSHKAICGLRLADALPTPVFTHPPEPGPLLYSINWQLHRMRSSAPSLYCVRTVLRCPPHTFRTISLTRGASPHLLADHSDFVSTLTAAADARARSDKAGTVSHLALLIVSLVAQLPKSGEIEPKFVFRQVNQDFRPPSDELLVRVEQLARKVGVKMGDLRSMML